MYIFPASHLKVYATTEKGLADEQSVFCGFLLLLAAPILLLAVSVFLRLHGLANENFMTW
jgi:hypothetical protein